MEGSMEPKTDVGQAIDPNLIIGKDGRTSSNS